MALTKVRNILDVTADTVADLLTMKHKKGAVQVYNKKGNQQCTYSLKLH